MNSQKKSPRYRNEYALILLIPVILFFACACGMIGNLYWRVFEEPTLITPERIAFALKVPIPDSAANVEYSGRWNVTDFFLSFEAPTSDMDAFTSEICPRQQFRSFNPFSAIMLDQRLEHFNMAFITVHDPMAPHQYYAYSPNTQGDTYGARCLVPGESMYFVNRISHDLSAIRLWHASYGSWPETDVRPVAEFPLLARGFWTDRDEYLIHAPLPLCFEIDPMPRSDDLVNFEDLIGATVTLHFGERRLDAVVDAYGGLTPIGEEPDSGYFSPCIDLNPRNSAGEYVALVAVTLSTGETLHYGWRYSISQFS